MATTGFEGFAVPDEKYTVITAPLTTNSGILDIFVAENRYAILATGSGIDVLDMLCGQIISSGTIDGVTINTLAADVVTTSGSLYVGTTASGVYAMRYHNIKSPGSNFSDALSSNQVLSIAINPAISSNEIRDICFLSGRILISTASGVDLITGNERILSTRPLISGSDSCFMTGKGEGYWSATNSGVEASYDLFSSSGTGIITVDFLYDHTTSPALPNNNVNDITIVTGTNNVLGIATISGDLLVEEVQGNESSSVTKSFLTEEVVSVDFGPGTAIDLGKLYLMTPGVVSVFDLSDDSEIGSHQSTIEVDDKFITENTRDQALISGTQTIIRTTTVI